MCTSLKNGVFLSQPTTSDINTFSINFVPPPSDNPDTENKRNENARIVETSKNGKLTHADVEKQTKHRNRYSKNYNELKHNHVDTHEEDYKRAFVKSEYFGAFFQQKIHTGTQKYLRSCAYRDCDKLYLRALNFSNIFE